MLDLVLKGVYLLLHQADIPVRCVLCSLLLCLLQVGVDDLLVGLHFLDDLMHILEEVALQWLYFLLNKGRQLLHVPFKDLDDRLLLLNFVLLYLHPIQLTDFDQYQFYSLQHERHMLITLFKLH